MSPSSDTLFRPSANELDDFVRVGLSKGKVTGDFVVLDRWPGGDDCGVEHILVDHLPEPGSPRSVVST
jgi:hypothetical protein